MDILVVGTERNFQELSLRLGDAHHFIHHPTRASAASDFRSVHLTFDFNANGSRDDFSAYRHGGGFLFLNTTMVTLAKMLSDSDLGQHNRICGFNGMDGFITHACLELTALSEEIKVEVSELLAKNEIEHAFVDDRIGMVTPRILCMIINEAFLTVQEGTASRADIDLAMKLGTNYPFGPFEWCTRIGIAAVYELLEALYADTHDERFRISSLLKEEHLANRSFNS